LKALVKAEELKTAEILLLKTNIEKKELKEVAKLKAALLYADSEID
jgi:hypothetical protein